jgi:hypothetical protein
MSTRPIPTLDAIEATLHDLIPGLCPPPTPRGRPEILPGALLWTGLLVCIVRRCTSQQALWRLLTQTGLWTFPRVPVTAEAVQIRLARSGPTVMAELFHHVTDLLDARVPRTGDLAPFAPEIYALDESTLDQVARTLPPLRPLPPGDDRLLPGKLIAAFNVRTQLFTTIQTTNLPRQNERLAARDLVATLPVGSLLLADLGYFGFRWFDDLVDAGYSFISRLREKTSYAPVEVLAEGHGVRDELIWLGAYRADRAKHLQRLVTVPVGSRTRRYLTSVLDPEELPVADLVALYGQRWSIEDAFKLVKRELGLHLVWSAQWPLILTQVWGVLLIAQIATALRTDIAARAGVTVETVSLALVLRDLPYLVQQGAPDVIGYLAQLPVVKGGYLRPARKVTFTVPGPLRYRSRSPDRALTRPPRYAEKGGTPPRTQLPPV